MREASDVRRRRILAVVLSRGAVRVSDLAAELEVSVVTVRRDVEQLARAGKLQRRHGMARSIVPVEQPPVTTAPAGGAVGLVVPERHQYLFEAVHGARTALEEAGLRAVLHIAPPVGGAERPIVERALVEDVRGLLIAPRWRSVAAEEADYAWLVDVPVPVVIVERRPRLGSVLHATDSVCSDHWYGVHLAIEHLVSLGHRRIILAARDDSPTARAIRAAFAEITAKRPEIEDATVLLSSTSATSEPDTIDELPPLANIVRERRATAAILHGDTDALMLTQQLTESGIRVPRDFSVIAYDDTVAGLGTTPLTAIAPPKVEVGRVAAELLLQRLDGLHGQPRRVQLLPELKIRESTQKI